MTTVTPTRAPLPRTSDPRIRAMPRTAAAPTLDPFRVLRRHLVLIIGTAVAGSVLGVVAFFLLLRFTPLYTAEALFEIREVEQSWSQPKAPKKITTKEVSAHVSEYFDATEKGEPMFRLVKAEPNKVLIEYNRAYSLKGYSQPMNRSVWMQANQPIEFSSLWNDNGFTKRLTLKRME